MNAGTDTVYMTNGTVDTQFSVGGFSVIDGATNNFIVQCTGATLFQDCSPLFGDTFNLYSNGAGVAVDTANDVVYVDNSEINSVAVFTSPFQITTTSLGSGTAGTAYSTTISTTGGTGPYSWSVPSGSLPPGLTLDPSTRTISGTATTAGIYNLTVQVTDSEAQAQTALRSLSITVAPSDHLRLPTPHWLPARSECHTQPP